jgi:hypothetical protein
MAGLSYVIGDLIVSFVLDPKGVKIYIWLPKALARAATSWKTCWKFGKFNIYKTADWRQNVAPWPLHCTALHCTGWRQTMGINIPKLDFSPQAPGRRALHCPALRWG